jgi:hypothetical protein
MGLKSLADKLVFAGKALILVVSLPIIYCKGSNNVKFVIKAGSSVYSYTITK